MCVRTYDAQTTDAPKASTKDSIKPFDPITNAGALPAKKSLRRLQMKVRYVIWPASTRLHFLLVLLPTYKLEVAVQAGTNGENEKIAANSSSSQPNNADRERAPPEKGRARPSLGPLIGRPARALPNYERSEADR
ncbi:hypothetical protein HPB50_013798 [Hyalomma asiaticum]|uniref:Uncharacterized protein n=1 Tax=Hyalomma asiaticum TaxID=266040 RepID=A0ACB7THL9_HYAAI|nr:hypothetical protein HPB50_013798 [Hyalomma asiaticum]